MVLTHTFIDMFEVFVHVCASQGQGNMKKSVVNHFTVFAHGQARTHYFTPDIENLYFVIDSQ